MARDFGGVRPGVGQLLQGGKHLASALGASTGLPDSIKFGTYMDHPEAAEENGLSFAETVIDIANQLAVQETTGE